MKKYTAYIIFAITAFVPTMQQALYTESMVQNPFCWFTPIANPSMHIPLPTVSVVLGNSFKNMFNENKTALGITALTGFGVACGFASRYLYKKTPHKNTYSDTKVVTRSPQQVKPYCYSIYPTPTAQSASPKSPTKKTQSWVEIKNDIQAQKRANADLKKQLRDQRETYENELHKNEQREYEQQQKVDQLLIYPSKDQAQLEETLLQKSLKDHEDNIALCRELKIMEEIVEKKRQKNLSLAQQSQELDNHNQVIVAQSERQKRQINSLREQVCESQDLTNELTNQLASAIEAKEYEITTLQAKLLEYQKIEDPEVRKLINNLQPGNGFNNYLGKRKLSSSST